MDLGTAIAVILALVAPWLTALATYPGMASWLKRLIAVVVAVVLATVVAIVTGQVPGLAPASVIAALGEWIVRVAIIAGLAQAYYSAWKPGVESLEATTDYTGQSTST